jgi:hypothetical protein
MTKPNLFSALNEAIAQRGELIHARQTVDDMMQSATNEFSGLRLDAKAQYELQCDKITEVEVRTTHLFNAILARLDAVIGEDPAEEKKAA